MSNSLRRAPVGWHGPYDRELRCNLGSKHGKHYQGARKKTDPRQTRLFAIF